MFTLQTLKFLGGDISIESGKQFDFFVINKVTCYFQQNGVGYIWMGVILSCIGARTQQQGG